METQADGAKTTVVRTTITLPDAMMEELRGLARYNGRPLSWEVRRAIQAHLEAESPMRRAA